ncbi:acetate--CoA ligase [Actinomycetospora chibensis]|uniref:acetate--CoA ligase n=1 Tax=Actinomycetospora chibensis TaxID=663606 RepID=A0ABV9RP17_9PSEU|nr:acetate--CoA ligase [Actinomycetospora chibensis]MDD7922237.1 acetate--CoA ligase [Actinomycetospora chibensis]
MTAARVGGDRGAIPKSEAVRRAARMPDYARARRTFSWSGARAQMSGLPDGRGLNIAHEAVDRHAATRPDAVALRVVDGNGATVEVTYSELRRRTNRFADVLRGLGMCRGDRVFTLLPRTLDLYVVALGTLKAGCVLSPLFSAFGPEPVAQRLRLGEGRVLVTTPRLHDRRVRPVRDGLPALQHVLLSGDGVPGESDASSLAAALAGADEEFVIPPTDPEDVALLHFTSGTTGTPKGAVHVHEAVVAHHATAAHALDLGADDVFWCTADPGWVTGTSYGTIAPLTHGATLLVDERDFDAERWYRTLAEQRISVWYTAPTALRLLARHGAAAVARHDLSALRHVASVGEPLNAEVVRWSYEVLGTPAHDNWWQTETGAIMISNYAAEEVRPGSMGRPMPGIEAGVLERGPDGRALRGPAGVSEVTAPDIEGELALRAGWPSMFRGYLHEDERYAASFADGWYLTGDVVRRDADGWFWFAGRADDVIKTAGHLVGPFEVESALMAHPAVAEAAVIGTPDPVAGELVKAFVTLRPGWTPDDALHDELLAFGRRRLGSVAPREITVAPDLPHTRSGKILRRLLRARELGLPEGDLSTVETP